MDVQVIQSDGSDRLYTGVSQLAITDNDSSLPYREKLAAVQQQLAALQQVVADLLAL
jgi:hypothetical protein